MGGGRVLPTFSLSACVQSSQAIDDATKASRGRLVSWCFEPSQPQGNISGLSS